MKNKIPTLILMLLTINLIQAQQTINESMVHNGVTREYKVYIPATYNATLPSPLMFNFHGWSMTADNQMTWTNMRPIADTAGFILVYPQGSLLGGITHWNVGSWNYWSSADDIGFTEAMIDTLAANYNIDLDRVYSCGYSNGGYFSYELACQLSSKIAAIGSVGGTMSTETFNACNPSRPMPVVSIHGTADSVVFYNGGEPFNSKSQEDVLSYWTQQNNTDTNSIAINLPNIYIPDGSTVTYNAFYNGDSCSSVEHYKVINGGHDWCGSWGNLDINASKIIWNFVSKYDLNGLIACNSVSVDEQARTTPIKVFPNPTDGIVSFRLVASRQSDYLVYSIRGELVANGTLNTVNNSVDLSHLPSSWYIIQIEGAYFRVYKRD